MHFEGKFWLLWEDEPLSLTGTRFFSFEDGMVSDARTGAHSGTYIVFAQGVQATFQESGGVCEVIKLSMQRCVQYHDIGVTRTHPPFDPDAEEYELTFSNVGYEQYAATRPAKDDETAEEEDARRDEEVERFGIVPMFGYGYRDCAGARELGERNEREYAARAQRETFTIV